MRKHLVVSFVLLVVALPAAAEVTLSEIFSDHMVLQQGMNVPVWGWAPAGTKVTITFAGQTQTAVAEPPGRWRVELAPMDASAEPRDLTVNTGDQTLTVKDVLVGEVWLCSGQSNMAWPVAQAANPDAEAAAANHPGIRMFRVGSSSLPQSKEHLGGQWIVCSPETVKGFSATAYYFGRELHKVLKVPVGLVNSSWGGTPIQAWTSREAQMKYPQLAEAITAWDKRAENFDQAAWQKEMDAYQEARQKWLAEVRKARAEKRPIPPKPKQHAPQNDVTTQQRPANLYNGMIAPLVGLAMRGVIWYQGEANAGNPGLYALQMPLLIRDWRSRWGRDFPFLFVQLPNFHAATGDPNPREGWQFMREAQAQALSLPKTGMAVTIDVGEAGDIHPKNKQDVGKRLALVALAMVYGKDVIASGPVYKSMEIEGNKVRLRFDHVDGGLLCKGDKLTGFIIAGEDGKFEWAEAKIDGDTVLVWSDKVASPTTVRYAWANNPTCSLYNKAHLPAAPFRTDAPEPPKPDSK